MRASESAKLSQELEELREARATMGASLEELCSDGVSLQQDYLVHQERLSADLAASQLREEVRVWH